MKNSIKDLFIDELKLILNGEKQIVKAFPDVVKATESPDLKEAIKTHLEETKEQVVRLEKIFKLIKVPVTEETNVIIQDMIKDCNRIINSFPQSALRDAGIIEKCQCVEHFEIAVYGTLRTFAKELEFDKVADLLQDTLDEEANADKTLTKIAEGGLLSTGINQLAK